MALLAGSVIAFIGIMLVAINILVPQNINRIKNIFEDMAFILFGILMLWVGALGVQGKNTVYINIGITTSQYSFFLISLVFGLFLIGAIQSLIKTVKRFCWRYTFTQFCFLQTYSTWSLQFYLLFFLF